ncbi:hypothetical protein R3P38DRAFT_3182585 [Favolaschia claudopus]|uniref:Uncharacterized protein n=1 Tax=Favolaschia claudopus TaxID=2862362 RepID=A0AAW0CFB5_9AGAR
MLDWRLGSNWNLYKLFIANLGLTSHRNHASISQAETMPPRFQSPVYLISQFQRRIFASDAETMSLRAQLSVYLTFKAETMLIRLSSKLYRNYAGILSEAESMPLRIQPPVYFKLNAETMIFSSQAEPIPRFKVESRARLYIEGTHIHLYQMFD